MSGDDRPVRLIVFNDTRGRQMRHRRLFTAAIFVASLVAGCANQQQSRPDDETATSEAEEGKRSRDGDADGDKSTDDAESTDRSALSEVVPELKPLELRDEAPPAEKLGEVEGVHGYSVGDLTILHKPTPANRVVSAKLYIDGGVAQLTDRTTGIEKLALRTVTNGGSESTPKDEFTSALDSMGSSVSSLTDRDYSGYSLQTIDKHFDESWSLFTDAILHPAMPNRELAVQRKKQLAEIEQVRQKPNQLVSHVARRLIAETHPYQRFQLGTPENVKAFERDHLLAHQRSMLNPARMVLVVVGNVSADEVIDKTRSSFGRLASEEWSDPELPAFSVGERALEGVQKQIPTNYILGLFPAPAPSHEDYPAVRVALSYLSDRLFEEVRTKRNLSYAVASGVSSHRTNTGYLYVSAKQPNETMQVIFDEIDSLKEETLSNDQVERTRNVFITEHYMDLETNSNLASNLARAELLQGDWREYSDFLERVKAVGPKDIERVAEKYLDDYQFGVVGRPQSVDRSVFGVSTSEDR